MEKAVMVKLSPEEHEKFASACKKTGIRRHHFAKIAILEKVESVCDDKESDGK
jgi:hypothetical protein